MPWGFECRGKLLKQRPMKPTKRVHPISKETETPGPDHYEPPKIYGGPGYSKIKRAPAYSFGLLAKPDFANTISPNAPMFDIRDLNQKGRYRIPGGLITPQIEQPGNKTKVPGPGTYAPRLKMQTKRAPAYSIRCAPKPPHKLVVQWTPPPNMYCPWMPIKCAPAYSFGYPDRLLTKPYIPGPGEHNPNFNYIKKSKPAFSFGAPYQPTKPPETPSPNIYCERKFMVSKRTMPAPSFGIRHSPYLGSRKDYLKPADLDHRITQI